MDRLEYERNKFAEKHRIFQISIQPILRMKERVFNYTMPKIILRSGKLPEVTYDFTDDQQKLMDLYDEQIAYIKRSIFGCESIGGALKQPLPEREG